MLAQVVSGAVFGMEAFLVQVEVDMVKGLPSMHVVGMAEVAVREGRERVMSALKHADINLPPRKTTINLSPADVAKSGSAFDLPIALGLLCAADKLDASALKGICAIGELGLDGELRPVRGVLPIADRCRFDGIHVMLVPLANAAEAAVVDGLTIYAADSLVEAVQHLSGKRKLHPVLRSEFVADENFDPALDFADVRAQPLAKRALEIAAAGQHNALLVGPPGSGKSMLARRLPGILPSMTPSEAVEVTKIYSIAGRLRASEPLIRARPFRAPHHSSSDAAMVGGGAYSRPGEVTLAHRGVLFLDELPEFRRNVLESLRQPLEDAVVTVNRARATVAYPARFMLIGAMNPCPCGYYGSGSIPCICAITQVQRYAARISGPLLDRIDLHVRVPPLRQHELAGDQLAESSVAIRERVVEARARQLYRYRGSTILSNAELNVRDVRRYCRVDGDAERTILQAVRLIGLSARAYHRVLRLARTIADLDGVSVLGKRHVSEAIQFRLLDRSGEPSRMTTV
jgi:magnesium chelatase family protein